MKPGRPQNMLAVLITVVDLKPHIIVLDKQYITDNNGIFLSAQIPTLQTEEGRVIPKYANRRFMKLQYPKMDSFPSLSALTILCLQLCGASATSLETAITTRQPWII